MTVRGGPKQERRRHPRAITNFAAIVTAHLRAYSARVINLSMGGALLDLGRVVPQPTIEIGDRLSIDIRCRGGAGPVRVEGRMVLWNTTSGDVPLLAVQFDETTDESAEILEDLMLEALSELRGRTISKTH
ncbi:MAG: PilZ domain-containing protein [Deltaproteobacteria bacterium]|nr:PilZ domain-containing protein [Deltaproteobacteria bacterium]